VPLEDHYDFTMRMTASDFGCLKASVDSLLRRAIASDHTEYQHQLEQLQQKIEQSWEGWRSKHLSR